MNTPKKTLNLTSKWWYYVSSVSIKTCKEKKKDLNWINVIYSSHWKILRYKELWGYSTLSSMVLHSVIPKQGLMVAQDGIFVLGNGMGKVSKKGQNTYKLFLNQTSQNLSHTSHCPECSHIAPARISDARKIRVYF